MSIFSLRFLCANDYRGGLGLTGGMADVGGLVDCLYGIYDGKAGLEILDDYDRIRREIYWTITDPVSTTNLARVRSDPETLKDGKDSFFAMLDESRKDVSVLDNIDKVSSVCVCARSSADRP